MQTLEEHIQVVKSKSFPAITLYSCHAKVLRFNVSLGVGFKIQYFIHPDGGM